MSRWLRACVPRVPSWAGGPEARVVLCASFVFAGAPSSPLGSGRVALSALRCCRCLRDVHRSMGLVPCGHAGRGHPPSDAALGATRALRYQPKAEPTSGCSFPSKSQAHSRTATQAGDLVAVSSFPLTQRAHCPARGSPPACPGLVCSVRPAGAASWVAHRAECAHLPVPVPRWGSSQAQTGKSQVGPALAPHTAVC